MVREAVRVPAQRNRAIREGPEDVGRHCGCRGEEHVDAHSADDVLYVTVNVHVVDAGTCAPSPRVLLRSVVRAAAGHRGVRRGEVVRRERACVERVEEAPVGGHALHGADLADRGGRDAAGGGRDAFPGHGQDVRHYSVDGIHVDEHVYGAAHDEVDVLEGEVATGLRQRGHPLGPELLLCKAGGDGRRRQHLDAEGVLTFFLRQPEQLLRGSVVHILEDKPLDAHLQRGTADETVDLAEKVLAGEAARPRPHVRALHDHETVRRLQVVAWARRRAVQVRGPALGGVVAALGVVVEAREAPVRDADLEGHGVPSAVRCLEVVAWRHGRRDASDDGLKLRSHHGRHDAVEGVHVHFHVL
eukprot:PhM_4_TR8450/c0_g1_i1/m.1416